MEIKYLGHSSFFIKGKSVSIVTDPYDSDMVGLKFAKHTTADIVTVSHGHPDHNKTDQIEGNPFLVMGPGEYEIKNVGIVGFSTFHDDTQGKDRGKNTIYRIELEGVSIVHLGDLGHVLSDKEVEALGNVDILLIPVGGHYTIDADAAKKIVSDIAPSVVIPMHYKTAGLNEKGFGMLLEVSAFLKEMGKETVVAQPKLSITKDKLPEEMQVVVLE